MMHDFFQDAKMNREFKTTTLIWNRIFCIIINIYTFNFTVMYYLLAEYKYSFLYKITQTFNNLFDVILHILYCIMSLSVENVFLCFHWTKQPCVIIIIFFFLNIHICIFLCLMIVYLLLFQKAEIKNKTTEIIYAHKKIISKNSVFTHFQKSCVSQCAFQLVSIKLQLGYFY